MPSHSAKNAQTPMRYRPGAASTMMIVAVSNFFRAESGRMFLITGGRIARIVRCLSRDSRPPARRCYHAIR